MTDGEGGKSERFLLSLFVLTACSITANTKTHGSVEKKTGGNIFSPP